MELLCPTPSLTPTLHCSWPVTLAPAVTGHAVDEITDLIQINFFGFFVVLA